jgi:peptidoglycan/xylan/chitin deacetylase (PgdA/CDA1 family)
MPDLDAVNRWMPTPLTKASAVVHLGAAAALVVPGAWPWALGTVAANHLLLVACGLAPRSTLLGPNWTRLPDSAAARGCIALTIDDGPDPAVTPRVLALLDEYEAKATFFCIGQRVARHRELAREIQRRGHSVENHSEHHRYDFSLLGPRAIADEIERAQQTIGNVVGIEPLFFRAPAGLRNPFLQPVLARLGLRLASWTRRGFDTVERNAQKVRAKLERNLRAGDILLLHDGHAAATRGGSAPVIVEVLPHLLGTLRAARLSPVTLRSTA